MWGKALRKIPCLVIILLFCLSSILPVVNSIYVEKSTDTLDCVLDNGLMDSAWPMFQHDNKHTGRSPCKIMLGSNKIDGIQDLNGSHFYGESNSSVYIVTVESQSDITLVSFHYEMALRSNGSHISAGSDYSTCWVTDGNDVYHLPGFGSDERIINGELRFLRFKFGDIINFTYDNRHYQQHPHNETLAGVTVNYDSANITLSAGKWHFIFTAMEFDLEQEDVLPDYKVWLNFSENLNISTSEGGKIYALCYPEFDANLIISKPWKFEFLLNGKASFNIENTFIYEFVFYPKVNGFWSIRWNTPDGIKNFNMIMRKHKLYYNENKVKGCVWDISRSGHYDFISSSIDYDPDMIWAQVPLFVGLDVKLP